MNKNNDFGRGYKTRDVVKRGKRLHISESKKRKSNKTKRMTGEEYVGFSTKNGKMKQDKLRNAREMGPCCSSTFCRKSKVRHCEKFDEDTRLRIFKSFWKLSPWSTKETFVQGLVRRVGVNGSRKPGPLRKQPFKYFLYLNGNAVQVLFPHITVTTLN